jgi:hypothetical protein
VTETLAWLLGCDPAIRWQALRDLAETPADEVAAERARVATEGRGAAVLARQAPDGSFGGSADSTGWDETNVEWNCLLALVWLREMGLDPDGDAARTASTRVAENIVWKWWDNRPFFHGEVEPCINGRVLALGAYFGHDSGDLVERLVGEQMADGGWNCEQENGSVRGSFHSTINVLEGLRAHVTAGGGSPAVEDALERGEEYLLERRLMRRLSTGEVIDPEITQLGFPTGYHYDVLRALDYFRAADRIDDRLGDALAMVEGKRQPDGRWHTDVQWPDQLHDASEPAGAPSPWLTLRALRVLNWSSGRGVGG